MVLFYLHIYGYVCLRNPFHFLPVIVKSYGNDIEHTFKVSSRKSSARVQISAGSFGNIPLLFIIHTFLRWGLYVFLAGLDLYKMYSFLIHRNDVYFQMATSPVPLKNRMTYAFQISAGRIFSSSA